MIAALDNIKIKVADLAAAAAMTELLLARAGSPGEESATFRLDNMTLELAVSEDGTQGVSGIAFEIGNVGDAHRVCERRALQPSQPIAFAESDATGLLRDGRHVDLAEAATFGVPITLVEYANTAMPPRARVTGEGAVTGLDHLVIRTTHPNRAAALYGARLGLDMRLDRTEPKWGARLMFFRCGDLIVEVVHNLSDEPSDTPAKLWGLSWRTANAEAANARLKTAGFDVSELRPGRKPGTRVFTVRNNTLGVPTLFVEPTSKEDR
jgi:catechol 2,3-dioxygenase-like lactoylglutathione lyase family enzyme